MRKKRKNHQRRPEQESAVSQRLHEVAEGAQLSWPTDDSPVGSDESGDEHLQVTSVWAKNQQGHQEWFL